VQDHLLDVPENLNVHDIHKLRIAPISVVLVSFNTRDLTLACLKSLQAELKEPGQVIVVDNASSDGSVDAIRGTFPQVRVIANDRNLGFGAANNIAFADCKNKYVLLLNTDTVVKAGSIKAMVNVLDKNPDAAAVGCRLENADGSLQPSCWSYPTPHRAWGEALGFSRLGLMKDWHRWDHASESSVDFVIGAALLVRRVVIEQVGGFDESFFLYAEETDWQRRMHAAGWRIRFTPSGTIIHLGGASGAVMRDRQLVESCRGIQRYVKKHHGVFGLGLFRLGIVVGVLLRLPVLLLGSLFIKSWRSRLQVKVRTLLWWCGFGPRLGYKELVPHSAEGTGE
jgi:GT2 family glycosyltransferase